MALLHALLDLCIVGVVLKSLLVCGDRLVELPHLLKCHGPPLIALVPVLLNFDALVGILQCSRTFALVEVACRAIRVQSVILWVLFDRISEVLNCRFVVLGGEGLGAQFFKGCHLLYLGLFLYC